MPGIPRVNGDTKDMTDGHRGSALLTLDRTARSQRTGEPSLNPTRYDGSGRAKRVCLASMTGRAIKRVLPIVAIGQTKREGGRADSGPTPTVRRSAVTIGRQILNPFTHPAAIYILY